MSALKFPRLMTRAEQVKEELSGEEICVCNGCNEEVRHVGEDGIDVCEGCGIVEGYTRHIPIEEYEEIHGL